MQNFKFQISNSIIVMAISLILAVPGWAQAQSPLEDAKASLFLSPKIGSFLVGSTFDVSIFFDTGGADINSVEANLKFPPDKLQVVRPSTGKSFISIWISPPTYSNKNGSLSFIGGLPSPGINASSGLVSKVTFRVMRAGTAKIEFLPSSKILANDGKGTNVLDVMVPAVYTLSPRPPEGPKIFSLTHSNENKWYSDKNPVVGWEKETGVSDFSFILDSFPRTAPDNIPEEEEGTAAFEDLEDGLWYFHIKAKKQGVWGLPSHFLLRIDTTPPAEFQPKVELLTAAIIQRAIVMFFTTDALSGIDHYEVAIIDKSEAATLSSPIFVEAESPYQIPRRISPDIRVFIRAVDGAGNIREGTVDATIALAFFPIGVLQQFSKNALSLLSFIMVVISVSVVIAFIMYRRKHKHSNKHE